MRRISGLLVTCALLGWASSASATEPKVVYPQAEEDDVDREWESHRRGPRLFVEAGFGAVYAPDLPITLAPSTIGDTVNNRSEGLLGPAGLVRWGMSFGATPNVDLHVGLGTFLGGAILDAGNQFFASPHALFSVAFGPGSVYRAAVGVTVGALIFEVNEERLRPQTAQFAAHAEASPLILRFGPSDLFEIALTQGFGVVLETEEPFDPCGVGCSSVDSGSDDASAHFAGHTVLSFGAVID